MTWPAAGCIRTVAPGMAVRISSISPQGERSALDEVVRLPPPNPVRASAPLEKEVEATGTGTS